MRKYEMTAAERRFADLIWDHEPVKSRTLVRLCEGEFQWKKSTTYTMLKKLCCGGIARNADSVVTTLISREDYERIQGEQLIDNAFGGSLPRFLAAFMRGKRLDRREIDELKRMIDEYDENDKNHEYVEGGEDS